MIQIRAMQGDAEATACATIMASTDPWKRLGRTQNDTLRAVIDPINQPFVAIANQQVVGVVLIQMIPVFNGYIRALAVREDHRNQRIGRRLLAFAEAHIFRTSPNVFLCVSSFNEDAQRLYQRLGYERIGEITNFIIADAGEILMRKTLGPYSTFKPTEQK